MRPLALQSRKNGCCSLRCIPESILVNPQKQKEKNNQSAMLKLYNINRKKKRGNEARMQYNGK